MRGDYKIFDLMQSINYWDTYKIYWKVEYFTVLFKYKNIYNVEQNNNIFNVILDKLKSNILIF